MSYFFLSILFVAKQNVMFFPHSSYIHFDFFKFTLRVRCSYFFRSNSQYYKAKVFVSREFSFPKRTSFCLFPRIVWNTRKISRYKFIFLSKRLKYLPSRANVNDAISIEDKNCLKKFLFVYVRYKIHLDY